WRQVLADRALAQQSLELADERFQIDRRMVADVVDGIGRRACVRGSGYEREYAHDAFDDVVDIGEVAADPAEIEHLDRRAGDDRAREQRGGHVGPAPRA